MNSNDRNYNSPFGGNRRNMPSAIGRQPYVGSAPAQPGNAAYQPLKRDYMRGGVHKDAIGNNAPNKVASAVHQVARYGIQAEMMNKAITGTWKQGFPGGAGAQQGGRTGTSPFAYPTAGTPSGPSSSIRPGLGQGAPGGAMSVHNSDPNWEQPAPKELEAGPRVHTVGTQKAVTDGGNEFGVKRNRALGPGTAPSQWSELSAEIQAGAAATGGKVINGRPAPTGPSVIQKQPRQKRRAGGNIEGVLGRRSWGGESKEDPLLNPPGT